MNRYEIRIIETIEVNGEIQGGDDIWINMFKTEKVAIKYAKKISFLKKYKGIKIYEVFIRFVDEENDIVSVWFVKNGIITHNDKG